MGSTGARGAPGTAAGPSDAGATPATTRRWRPAGRTAQTFGLGGPEEEGDPRDAQASQTSRPASGPRDPLTSAGAAFTDTDAADKPTKGNGRAEAWRQGQGPPHPREERGRRATQRARHVETAGGGRLEGRAQRRRVGSRTPFFSTNLETTEKERMGPPFQRARAGSRTPRRPHGSHAATAPPRHPPRRGTTPPRRQDCSSRTQLGANRARTARQTPPTEGGPRVSSNAGHRPRHGARRGRLLPHAGGKKHETTPCHGPPASTTRPQVRRGGRPHHQHPAPQHHTGGREKSEPGISSSLRPVHDTGGRTPALSPPPGPTLPVSGGTHPASAARPERARHSRKRGKGGKRGKMAEPTHPERESNPRIFKPPRRNALGTWDGLGEGKRAPHSPLPLRGLGPRIGEEAAPHSERTRPWRLTARAVSKRPTLRHRTTSRAGERTDRGTTNPAPPWGAGRFGRIDSHGHVGTAGAVCENRLGPGQPLPRRPRQRGRGGHSLTRRHHSRHRVPPSPRPGSRRPTTGVTTHATDSPSPWPVAEIRKPRIPNLRTPNSGGIQVNRHTRARAGPAPPSVCLSR